MGGHVARMRDEMHTKFLTESLKERDHFGDLGVDGKIILEWISGKYGGKM
jgi:hypothetical protein